MGYFVTNFVKRNTVIHGPAGFGEQTRIIFSLASLANFAGKLERSQNTPAAHGLEELFSIVLGTFLVPIHTLRVYCKN